MPKFSVIIPVVSLNAYVDESVSALQSNTFSDWELLIVTNNKEASKWNDFRIKILDSGRVGPGEKRDMASKVATGEILAFLDDDAYPDRFWLENAAQVFSTGVRAIGGPSLTPPSNSFWQKVSGSMYEKKLLGGDPIRYSRIKKNMDVDDWPSVNLFVKRDIFLEVGGFDCKFWPGEDTFLCLKLKKMNIKIKYSQDVFVWHHRRPNLFSHLKQLSNYGLHRGYFARHYPATSFRIKYFLPTFLLIATLSLLSSFFLNFTPLKIITSVLLVIYILSVLSTLISMLSKYKILHLATLFFYTISSHLLYGFHFLRGFLKLSSLQSKLRAE
jgi:GT2 family glycosyltransferase